MAHGRAKKFCSKFCRLKLWILEILNFRTDRNCEQQNVLKILQLQGKDQSNDYSDTDSLFTGQDFTAVALPSGWHLSHKFYAFD